MISQFKVFMSPEAGMRVQKTLYSGFIGQGAVVEQFEGELGKKLGSSNLLAVNSGTSALQLALHLIDKPNNFVFTTPLTCFATTAAILNSGLEPHWIDVNPGTCNMSLSDLEHNLKQYRPAAIVVVHYGGYPVDLEKLHGIAGDIPVVEDCAHAMGSYVPQGHVGTQYGNYGCFSFQAIKTLTTGDGGAIIVPGDQYQRAKKLRWFGLSRDVDRHAQDIDESGFKYQMNDIAATIGLANLEHLDTNLRLQQANVRFYQDQLPDLSPCYHEKFQASGWMYPVTVGNAESFDKAMKSRGVQTGLGHGRNDLYSCVSDYKSRLPGLEWTVRSTTCIPSGWWLAPDDKEYIVECINKGW